MDVEIYSRRPDLVELSEPYASNNDKTTHDWWKPTEWWTTVNKVVLVKILNCMLSVNGFVTLTKPYFRHHLLMRCLCPVVFIRHPTLFKALDILKDRSMVRFYGSQDRTYSFKGMPSFSLNRNGWLAVCDKASIISMDLFCALGRIIPGT